MLYVTSGATYANVYQILVFLLFFFSLLPEMSAFAIFQFEDPINIEIMSVSTITMFFEQAKT